MSAMLLPGIFSLLTPLLWVAALFFFLLAVRSVLQRRSSRKRRDVETIEWGPPRPSLIQRWRTNIGRIRFRLPRFSQRQMPEIAPKPTPLAPATPPADPLKKRRCSRSWFDYRCARDQTQRGVRLGENEGNRMRDKLPRTPLHA
jgi:hypothetical protein